jgi:hypothetical protein
MVRLRTVFLIIISSNVRVRSFEKLVRDRMNFLPPRCHL